MWRRKLPESNAEGTRDTLGARRKGEHLEKELGETGMAGGREKLGLCAHTGEGAARTGS